MAQSSIFIYEIHFAEKGFKKRNSAYRQYILQKFFKVSGNNIICQMTG